MVPSRLHAKHNHTLELQFLKSLTHFFKKCVFCLVLKPLLFCCCLVVEGLLQTVLFKFPLVLTKSFSFMIKGLFGSKSFHLFSQFKGDTRR